MRLVLSAALVCSVEAAATRAHAQTSRTANGAAPPPTAGPSAAAAPPAGVSGVLAQPTPVAPPTPEQDRQARTQFLQGREAFARGQFLEAAERFERAYDLSHRAALLYNLGTTYDRLHRWEDAREAFRRYVREVPSAPELEEVTARLLVIEQTIAREAEMRAAAARAATQPRVVVVERQRERIIVERVGEPRPFLVTGLVVGGLGVISGIASGAIAIFTETRYADATRSTPDPITGKPGCALTAMGCGDEFINDIAIRPALINSFWIAAVGLVAVGGVFLLVDVRRPRPVAAAGAPPGGGTPSATPARPTSAQPSLRWLGLVPSAPGAGTGLTLMGAF